MSPEFPQIAARIFDTPLLIDPGKARVIASAIGGRVLGRAPRVTGADQGGDGPDWDGVPGAVQPRASVLTGSVRADYESEGQALYSVRDGVAIIPVTGTLVHRGAWVGAYSGLTSYEGLSAQVAAAADDPAALGIVLEIDSPGGEVSGLSALAATIRAAAAVKPVRAIIADAALSAAYGIASAATEITIPPSGFAGSIGVITMHADMSRALDAQGVTVTVIAAGAQKADGNPYAPLPEDVRDRFHAQVLQLRDLFAAEIGRGRGARLTADKALATEAAVLIGADAVAAGLADMVAEPADAFRSFAAGLAGTSTAPTAGASAGGAPMAHRNARTPGGTKPRAPARATGTTPDPEAMDAPEDEAMEIDTPPEDAPESEDESEDDAQPEAMDAPEDEAMEDDPAPAAAAAERRRIAAIMDAPEARGRDALARHLALKTATAPADARKIMAAAAADHAGSNSLARRMSGRDAPAPRAGQQGSGVLSLADRYKLKQQKGA
jgi:ClpP class serine protease